MGLFFRTEEVNLNHLNVSHNECQSCYGSEGISMLQLTPIGIVKLVSLASSVLRIQAMSLASEKVMCFTLIE